MRKTGWLALFLAASVGCGGGPEKGVNKDKDRPVPEKPAAVKKTDEKKADDDKTTEAK